MSQVRLGLIGGSGMGQLLDGGTDADRHEVDTPFGRPSDVIVETRWADVPVFLLNRHGPGHLLQPAAVPYRANLFALKRLGVTHVLATGAVGSLREEIRPRDVVVADQVIDKTHRRAASFYEHAAVHVELAEPFCPVLRQTLIDAGKDLTGAPAAQDGAKFAVHDSGCYVCMEGPAFSTRAESLMHRLWGGDLIGMTAMPEARLAREAELPYALAALVTDYDSWKPHAAKDGAAPDPLVLLNEIIGHLKAASGHALALLKRAVERIAADPGRLDACPASRALELAIWSDKSRIPAGEIDRLRPLWGRYFQDGSTEH